MLEEILGSWWRPAEPIRFVILSILFLPLMIGAAALLWQKRGMPFLKGSLAVVTGLLWLIGLWAFANAFFGGVIGVKYFSVRGQLFFPFETEHSRGRGGGNVENARAFSKGCGKRGLLSISPPFPRSS